MSLAGLLHVAHQAVPGLGVAATAVEVIYTRVQDVKVYRQQCRDLAARCRALLVTVHESSENMEGTKGIEFADEVEANVSRISRRVDEWASYSRVRSLLNLNDIKSGIDAFYRDIDACFAKFNVKINMELNRGQRDLVAMQESDRAEIREMLRTISTSVEELKAITKSSTPAALEEIMESIQEELDDPGLDVSEQIELQRGLTKIRKNAVRLPPMTDLTGQIEKIGDHPVALGTFNDIYIGRWADDRKVALRLPRALTNTPEAQKRFEREVDISRRLQHPNVTRLYGIAYFGGYAYMVSHWMDHGNAIAYVQNYPEVDRLRLLGEVASGMEYLHMSKVVHGDLRGANVLISKRGKACLSDFGLSRVMEEYGQAMTAAASTSNSRWNAPELIDPALVGEQHVSFSVTTDVWSFGMLCLELMTGQMPFHDVAQDVSVAMRLMRGSLPTRPGSDVTVLGLSDGLWGLMLRCWKSDPTERPSMSYIKQEIKRLRRASNSSPSLSIPSLTTSPLSVSGGLDSPPVTPISMRQPRRPSTAGSSSSESFTHDRRSSISTIFSNMKRPWAAARSQQRSPVDLASSIPSPSPRSLISPLSSSLSVVVTPDSDDNVLGLFSSNLSRNYGGSMQETSHSRQSSPQIPISSSLPVDYGSHLTFSNSFTKPPSLRSTSSSTFSANLISFGPTHALQSTPIQRSEVGFPEAATLFALVEQLVTDFPNAKMTEEYRDVFLNTYSAFATSAEVFGMLEQLFQNGSSVSGQQRALRRINVITIYKRLTMGKIDEDVLRRMEDFAQSLISSAEASGRMQELANDLMDAIALHFQDPPICNPRPQVIQPAHPRDLATALLILEGDRFSRISSVDCISHLRKAGKSDIIKNIYETNNNIGNWVKQGILRYEDVENRSEVIRFFVHTAEECRTLRNFASMSALVNALQSPTITDLGLTYDRLPKLEKGMLKSMNGMLDPKHNHSAYRAVLNGSPDIPCVPFLAVHIRDLHNAFSQRKDTVQISGSTLINFAKWAHFYACVRDVLRHKAPDISTYRQTKAGVLAYLEHELDNISSTPNVDKNLDKRSRFLVDKENVLRELKIPNLNAVGMR